MTLITRLATSFTDTTLPRLIKDPVIPAAGARLLVDMKSSATWPSQASSITTSNQLFSIADTTPAWPTLAVAGTHTYSPTRGGLLGNNSAAASSGLWLSDTSTNIFNNAAHSWAFTLWFYRGAGIAGSLFNMFDDRAVSINAYAATAAFQLTLFGADGTANSPFLSVGGNSVKRVGFTVYQDSSFQWKYRTVVDNAVPLSEVNLNGATNTQGGLGLRASASGTTRPRIFGSNNVPNDYVFYRTYAENLTLSGRTFQQVFDADWARGNGRFS
jgi:hypothetical protein